MYVLAKVDSTQPLSLLLHKVKYYSIKLRDLHCGFTKRGKNIAWFSSSLVFTFSDRKFITKSLRPPLAPHYQLLTSIYMPLTNKLSEVNLIFLPSKPVAPCLRASSSLLLQWNKCHSFYQKPIPNLILTRGNPLSRISLLAWLFFFLALCFSLHKVTSISIHTDRIFLVFKVSLILDHFPATTLFVSLYNRNTWKCCVYLLSQVSLLQSFLKLI